MRQKDLKTIIAAAVATAIISFILAGVLFTSPKQRTSKVPVVQKINSTFPDVQNDSDYNSFLNSSALDPTQPVHISGNHNTTPFGSGP